MAASIFSLFCAFLSAVSPVLIFFSRNLQPDAPALFFMLLGSLFYLKFLTKQFKKRNLVFGGISFAIAGCYQCNFLIGIFPFLFCFPKESCRKDLFRFILALLGPYMIVGAIALGLTARYDGAFAPMPLFAIPEALTLSYWGKYGFVIWRYATAENFTLIFVLCAVVGAALALSGLKSMAGRYIAGWIPAIILYALIFSREIIQQSYFQMPFAAFICLATGYAFYWLRKYSRNIFIATMAVTMIGVNTPFIYQAVKGMHWTVFLGLDVAGESLKEFTKPQDRIFLHGHAQGNGIARYAQRYMGWPENLEDFKKKEEKFNVKYACFYPIEYVHILKTKDPELFKHIEDTYKVKEIGYAEEASRPVYIILEKGRGQEDASLLEGFNGHSQLRTIYRMFGRYVFFIQSGRRIN